MVLIVFIISLGSISTIFILCALSLITPKFQFFPPPTSSSWQFHLFWTLFRIFIVGLIVVSFLDFNNLIGSKSYWPGLLLLIGGMGSAIYLSYYTLGKTRTYGGKSELYTKSIYNWSRNPIYLVSFVGMLGWGLFVNSVFTWSLLAIWAVLYLLAPFIEEPWLEQQYGVVYSDYKARTPRFIGIPKR